MLSEFRTRLVQGNAEQGLLDTLLERVREAGLLKTRGRQRTDSTHVLAAVRMLNRLERVGETLRAALNALAGGQGDAGGSHQLTSPDDTDARNSTKRHMEWIGYKVHFTETCDANTPHLIVNVETTPATTPDDHMAAVVHASLKPTCSQASIWWIRGTPIRTSWWRLPHCWLD